MPTQGQLFKVGEYYSRPCIKTRGVWLPILNLEPHDDLAIGIEKQHVHVDSRFLGDEVLASRETSWAKGFIWAIFLEEIQAVELRQLLCQRRHILRIPTYRLAGMAGAEEVCRDEKVGPDMRCPHKGQKLDDAPVIGGCWQCPAHGLHWNQSTGELIPIYIQLKQDQDALAVKVDAAIHRLEALL